MLSHVTLGVNNLDSAIEFYDAILETLNQKRRGRGENWAGYGDIGGLGIDTLWILSPLNGKPATGGNGTTIALLAPNRHSVREFHAKALELGAKDEGKPGLREENHPNFYAAYIRDIDGNYLCAVCHEPEQN